MDKRKRTDQVIDDSPEPQYHVYIRLPFNRGDFVDPGTVNWSERKSEALWSVLSGVSLENVDWSRLAAEFDVDVDFLLQMANYLSERHASQIRAQMLRAAAVRGSNAPSPVPGADPPGSHHMAAEPMRRTSSAAGRGSSALSMRREIAAALPKHLDDQGKTTVPNRPDTSRNSSGNTAVPSPNQPGSRPGTANPPNDPPRRPLSYLATSPASQQQPAQPPPPQPQAEPTTNIPPSPAASTSPSPSSSSSSSSSSSDSPVKSRIFGRPPRFLTAANNNKPTHGTGRFPGRRPRDTTSADGDNDDDGEDDDDDDDDEPAFLPVKPTRQDHNPSGLRGGGSSSTGQDMGATLRGDPRDFAGGRSARRMTAAANDGGGGAVLSASQTSDESPAGSAAATPGGVLRRPGGATGLGAGVGGVGDGGMRTPVAAGQQRQHQQQQQGQQTPLSPRRTAELAGRRGTGSSAGRGKGASREGSDGTPSMGSSFSDLDDASVTQSALEEALASRMQDGTIGSRMSVLGGTIGQAFRSRYLPKSNR